MAKKMNMRKFVGIHIREIKAALKAGVTYGQIIKVFEDVTGLKCISPQSFRQTCYIVSTLMKKPEGEKIAESRLLELMEERATIDKESWRNVVKRHYPEIAAAKNLGITYREAAKELLKKYKDKRPVTTIEVVLTYIGDFKRMGGVK